MSVGEFKAIVDVLRDIHFKNLLIISLQYGEYEQSVLSCLRLKGLNFKTRAQNTLHDLIEFDFTVPRFPMRRGRNVVSEGLSENFLT